MKELQMQIYNSKRNPKHFAVVDKRNNYALCVEGEEPDGFVGFRQDGSWTPVEFADAPVWLQEQIEDFNLFGVGKEVKK